MGAMKEKHKGAAIAGALALIAVVVFAVALKQQLGVKPEPIISPAPNTPEEQNYCTQESREAQMCIEVYDPACGWLDPAQIQCIKYPCAQTFSNSCFACMDRRVLYWTKGECKSADS